MKTLQWHFTESEPSRHGRFDIGWGYRVKLCCRRSSRRNVASKVAAPLITMPILHVSNYTLPGYATDGLFYSCHANWDLWLQLELLAMFYRILTIFKFPVASCRSVKVTTSWRTTDCLESWLGSARRSRWHGFRRRTTAVLALSSSTTLPGNIASI